MNIPKKRSGLVVGLIAVFTLGLAMVAFAVPTVIYASVSYHLGSDAEFNQESYWEGEFGQGVSCTKDDTINDVDSYVLPVAPTGAEYEAVIVKAGSGLNANTIFAEDDLAAGQTVWADNDGDKTFDEEPPEISHIIFCYSYELDVAKNAAGTFDRTVEWDLVKNVTTAGNDLTEYTGIAGDTFPTGWLLFVDKTETVDNYQVTGSITIVNNTPFEATIVSVEDFLDDGTQATVDCGVAFPSTLAVGGTLNCTYTASPTDGSAILNTATVTTSGDVAGAEATAEVSFTENLIGFESGTLTDDRFPAFSQTVNGDFSTTLSETFVCPTDPSAYGEDGSYTAEVVNTADLNDNIDLQDDAKIALDCTLPALQVEKDAAGTFDRTVTWTLDKSVAPATHSGYPGDTFDSIWTVVADKTEVSGNYQVTGTISIYNPAAITQSVTGVSDVLGDGTDATVDCGAEFPIDIAPLGTLECTYTAAPGDASATLNTAIVSATGNADQEATAVVAFTENLIGDDTVTVDDDRDDEGNFPAVISTSTTFDYDETFVCSTDWADYTSGVDSDSYLNTATLTGESTNLSDDAQVDVTCEAGTVDVLKYTDGVVDPEKDWQFALYIGPDGFGGTQVGSTSSTLGDGDGVLDFGMPALRPDTTYTVCEVGVPAGWTSFWQLNGSTVIPYNPDANSDPSEDLGNRCVDFGGTVETPVTAGTVFSFVVDNSFPGGDPRTPGYWKNWNRCTRGGQQFTADANGGWQEGYWLLEDVLDPDIGGGIVWDDILGDDFVYVIDECEQAVAILDHRTTDDGKKVASDPLHNLARNLLAAQLNFGAGACTTQGALDAALAAEKLLDKYDFDGTYDSKRLPRRSADAGLANSLATYLDDYNNGEFCGSTNGS